MEYTYSDDIISDLHKDARGFRPDEYFWEEWTQSPPESKQFIWDKLCKELEVSMKEQAAAEADALVGFRKALRQVMDTCHVGWQMALQYLADAEDEDISHEQGFDYFLWLQGIGYNDRAKIRKHWYGEA